MLAMDSANWSSIEMEGAEMPGSLERPDTAETAHEWALVLAAGEGSRLRQLTTMASGIAVPKQFCSLAGGTSLLYDTLRRAQVIAPAQRTVAIVSGAHRRWWCSLAQLLPDSNIVVQPGNRGTAIGILLPLLSILQRDAEAVLIVLPSDHFVGDEGVLADATRQAMSHARSMPALVLLGFTPEDSDPELGYIVVRETPATDVLEVSEFVEKPDPVSAGFLMQRGALWNSFIFAIRARVLLQTFMQLIPGIVAEMADVVRQSGPDALRAARLARLYVQLPNIDFSRDVMRHHPHLLRVLRVPACGWSDLGTPRRVADALRRGGRGKARAGSPAHLAGFLDLESQQLQARRA